MEQHYWWMFALLQPIGFSGVTLLSQHYKKSGFSLVTIRACFILLCLLPFTFFVEAPSEPIFYISTFVAALLAFFADSLLMNSSAKFGAGTTSRILPISPLLGFVIWLVVNPESFYKFIDTPVIGTGIVLSLIGCVYAISHLQRCEISKRAFVYLVPVILCFAINDTMNKTAQDNSGFWNGIIWYTFFLALVSIVTGLLLHMKDKSIVSSLQDKVLLKAAFLIALSYGTAMIGRNISMVYTDNPAYTSIIAGSTPLFIFVYHKIFNIEDNANVKAGLLFTMSVLMLIFLASFIK